VDSLRQVNYKELFKQVLDEEILKELRSVTQKGLVLGRADFSEQIEMLSNDRLGGRTNDFTVNGVLQTDVKRFSGVGVNAASQTAESIKKQLGSDGGQIIIVRAAGSNARLSQFKRFFGRFKTEGVNVNIRVVDETALPKLKGVK